jgi:hypothetical protein
VATLWRKVKFTLFSVLPSSSVLCLQACNIIPNRIMELIEMKLIGDKYSYNKITLTIASAFTHSSNSLSNDSEH